MGLTITLSGEEEERLTELADLEGTSKEELASILLGHLLGRPHGEEIPESEIADEDLPECWRGHVGRVRSGGSSAARYSSQLYGELLWLEHQQRKQKR